MTLSIRSIANPDSVRVIADGLTLDAAKTAAVAHQTARGYLGTDEIYEIMDDGQEVATGYADKGAWVDYTP